MNLVNSAVQAVLLSIVWGFFNYTAFVFPGAVRDSSSTLYHMISIWCVWFGFPFPEEKLLVQCCVWFIAFKVFRMHFFLLFSFFCVCVLEGDKGWDYRQFLRADDFMVQDQLSKQPFLLNGRILNLWVEVIGSGKVILHLKAWGRFSEMLGSVPWHVCGSRYCKAELPQLSLAVSVPMGWWLYGFAVVCVISEESKGVQMAMSEKNGSS